MKAWVIRNYGGPEVLSVDEMEFLMLNNGVKPVIGLIFVAPEGRESSGDRNIIILSPFCL